MTPDYEAAALRATEILIKHGISSAPIDPLPILESTPDVIVMSYEELSSKTGESRDCLMTAFGDKSRGACTTVNVLNGKRQYIVTYNQKLPFVMVHRTLARELGHIILGHDGSRPEDVRHQEAKAFSHHLLCPRPLINAIISTGIRLTSDVLGNLTGCNDYCINCMRKIPATHVQPELNRKVRDQFMDYIINFFKFQSYARPKDGSAVVDLGSYMDGYEE